MLDKELALEVLRQIEESAQKIIDRFQIIEEPDNFSTIQKMTKDLKI